METVTFTQEIECIFSWCRHVWTTETFWWAVVHASPFIALAFLAGVCIGIYLGRWKVRR